MYFQICITNRRWPAARDPAGAVPEAVWWYPQWAGGCQQTQTRPGKPRGHWQGEHLSGTEHFNQSSYSLFPTSCTLCQVMWPSLYLSPGQMAETVTQSSVLHRAVVSLARSLLGPDMDFDFDMLISKEGGSTVETPWHQDESYWLDLPDKVNRILI